MSEDNIQTIVTDVNKAAPVVEQAIQEVTGGKPATRTGILARLKSPIVIINLILVIGAGIVLFVPSVADTWKIVAGILAGVSSLVAGVNNPTDSVNF